MSKHALITDTPEGGNAVVVCNSYNRAAQVREVIESKGGTTRGIVPAMSLPEAVLTR